MYVVHTSFRYTVPDWLAAPSSTPDCGWLPIGEAALNRTVLPATPSTFGPGVSNAWVLIFATPSNASLLATVVNGSAKLLATMPPTQSCTYAFSDLRAIGPRVVDSSRAVQIGNSDGGAAFLASFPRADASLTLVGGSRSEFWSCPADGCPPGTGQSVWTLTYSVRSGAGNPASEGGMGLSPTNLSHEFSAVIDSSSGAVYSAAVTFPTYSVTFTESGLPDGTVWSITLDGHTSVGSGMHFFPSIPNGTYTYAVGSVDGYDHPQGGSLTIAGSNLTQVIGFRPSGLLGLPVIEGYLVVGAVVTAATTVALVAVLQGRRKAVRPGRGTPATRGDGGALPKPP